MSDSRPKYQLVEYIGKGGMGQVFRGVSHGENGFRRDVAIKRLRSSVARDDDAQRKFLKEALISASLDHPNIVPVFDYAKDKSGRLCLIMAYVDGIDLHEVMEAQRLPIPVVLYIIDAVLRGLAHAHDHGIIHRDIKPANVMVSRAGTVQLTDFGLAHDTSELRPPSYGGTPGFMSPEALQEWPQDARSDLFSVGVMFYELLTGTRPFPGTKPIERIANTLTRPPPSPIEIRPEISEKLSVITMRLLSQEPAERFTSALEVLDALPQPRHGSEDLAAIVSAIMLARVNPELSSEDELTTERFRRKIGDTLWGEANDGHTVLAPGHTALAPGHSALAPGHSALAPGHSALAPVHTALAPVPIPIPIPFDPEIAMELPAAGRLPVTTGNGSAEARPAMVSMPGSPAAMVSMPGSPAEHVEPAERAPSPAGPDRESRPRRTLYLALAAAALLSVCAVLGERALRHDVPADTATAPSTTPAPVEQPARDEIAPEPGLTRDPARGETRDDPAALRAPEDTQPHAVARAAERRARVQARRQPKENREATERPVRWRTVPIGTDSPWDVPIHREVKP